MAMHCGRDAPQVLVAVVTPDGALQRRAYRPDAEYFYPASSVKSVAAVAALRELRRCQAQWRLPLHMSCPLVFHPQRASRVCPLLGFSGGGQLQPAPCWMWHVTSRIPRRFACVLRAPNRGVVSRADG
jgi:hypothetical protein